MQVLYVLHVCTAISACLFKEITVWLIQDFCIHFVVIHWMADGNKCVCKTKQSKLNENNYGIMKHNNITNQRKEIKFNDTLTYLPNHLRAAG